MAIELPPLPWAENALVPHISPETIQYHYGKHHQAYVTNLNKLIEGTPNAGKSLEEIVKSSEGGVFNNAAQVWNHTFYWHSMKPGGGGKPSGAIAAAIDSAFGGYDKFRQEFANAGATQFGSGWAWLVHDGSGLAVAKTANQDSPVSDGQTPLLGCDVWEHAYYLKYQNKRPDYIDAFWNVVNWDYVAQRLADAG
jgi:Fe-Mn family superoxide dismutase